MNDQKDTVYVDIDDEITAVIDKLRGSPKKIVALVLPKRATVFQSIVNMKLLKRTADEAHKHVVLVTSEAALMPLAGAVGLHVAKTPQSKPEVPAAPGSAADEPEKPLDKSAAVGALALAAQDDDESIEVDNSEDTSPDTTKDKKSKKKKKGVDGKKLKVPNFEKFRSKLFLGVAALVLLIAGWVLAFMILPKATITLKTDTTDIDTNLTFTADPSADELDTKELIVPASKKEFRKTDTEKVSASGEKDLGKKASGSVTMSIDCGDVDGSPPTIPAGTGVTTNNLTYITKNSASLTNPDFSDGCSFTGTASVVAQRAGDQYNIDGGESFTVAGYSAVSGTNTNDMSGGTSRIVKIITQADIDKGRAAIADRAKDDAPDDLKAELEEDGYYPLEETLSTGAPTVTSTPGVNAEASETTVTSTVVYTMLGVKKDDLQKLVEESAKKEIDEGKQVIRDNGIDDANITVDNKEAGGKIAMSLQTTVVAGPNLDADAIKKEAVGKKRGDIIEHLKQRPGINDVEVSYSPFWVQSTPKSTTKITIVFESTNDPADSPD